jgi:hypothetical protein
MTNLHPATNEEQVWERLNLWDRIAPNMGLSAEDRILLGPLADIMTYSDHPAEINTHLYECTKRVDRSNSTALMKSLCGLDRAYELLVDAGYSSFQPARSQMQIGLRRLTLTALKSLTRDMLATPDDELAEEISVFLIDVIARGAWSLAEFSAESEAWFAELQARRGCHA